VVTEETPVTHAEGCALLACFMECQTCTERPWHK
jgi:hypothetical protein